MRRNHGNMKLVWFGEVVGSSGDFSCIYFYFHVYCSHNCKFSQMVHEKLLGKPTLLKVACLLGSFCRQPYGIRTYPISTSDQVPDFYKKCLNGRARSGHGLVPSLPLGICLQSKYQSLLPTSTVPWLVSGIESWRLWQLFLNGRQLDIKIQIPRRKLPVIKRRPWVWGRNCCC